MSVADTAPAKCQSRQAMLRQEARGTSQLARFYAEWDD